MEELESLNRISEFTFGVLTAKNTNYLKFKGTDEVFVPSESSLECDLVTLQTIGKQDVVVNFENSELKLEPERTYFLKPIPENIEIFQQQLNVKFFTLVDKLRCNSFRNNQLDFKKELFFNLLRSKICHKKLRMTCWPFSNISLKTFLATCRIPYSVIVTFTRFKIDKSYVFDPKEMVKTYRTEEIRPGRFFYDASDTTTNGTLFCCCKERLKKTIINFNKMQYCYRDDWSNFRQDIVKKKIFENVKAFIIFNHEEPSNGENERVLEKDGDCAMHIF